MTDTIPDPTSIADVHLLPIRNHDNGTPSARAENYVVTMELDIRLPHQYLGLPLAEKRRVRDTCFEKMCSDGKGMAAFEKLCLCWERVPVEHAHNREGTPITLGQLRQLIAANLNQYNREVWMNGRREKRGNILPPTLSQMGQEGGGETHYVWRDGEFVCIHSVPLYEQSPAGNPKPWTFEVRLPSGAPIQSDNRAIVSWSIL